MRRKQRVLVWGVLLALLGAGVGLIVLAQQRGGAVDEGTLDVTVVDERGRPATWATVLLHDDAPTAVREAARWDANTGILTLPRAGRPHGIHISGPGFLTTRVDGIRGDAQVEVRRGFALHIDITGDLPATTPAPRVLMVRVVPVVDEPDPTKAAALVDQVTRYMMPMTGTQEGSMPLFATRGFGFTLSSVDAAGGMRVPQAGRYRVVAGLHDQNEGLWQELRASSVVVVPAHAKKPVRGSVEVSAKALRAAGKMLDAQIAALRARQQAGSQGADDPGAREG